MLPKTKRMVCDVVPRPIRPAIAQVLRSCRFKKVYETPEAAQSAVDSIKRTGNDNRPQFELRPYKCDICFAFHVGHNSRNKRPDPSKLTYMPRT